MNKTQEGAWYGVLLSFLLAGVVVFDFLDTRVGLMGKLLVSIIWGGLLLGPLYLIGRKRQPPGVDMDERDKQIIKKALLTSFAVLATMIGVAFVVAFLALGLKSTISITMDEVAAVVYFVLVAFVLVLSSSVLVQYRWGSTNEQ